MTEMTHHVSVRRRTFVSGRYMAVAAAVWLILWAAPSAAQLRVVPQAPTTGDVLVEVAEQGAIGDLQFVPLRWHSAGQADDLLIYDRTSGAGFLVVALGVPVPGAIWATPYPIAECYAVLQMRPGLRLSAIDLDRDGRADVIGYQPLTGHVVRYYRRARGC